MIDILPTIQGVIDGLTANGMTAFIAAIPALFRRASRAELDQVTDAAVRYDTATTDTGRTDALGDLRVLMSSYLTRYPEDAIAFETWGKAGIVIENHAPNQGQQGIFNGGTFTNNNA
ncbi:hypothetical protein GCM10007079_20850 [Nocardiopsis terrae]|uniref:Uncharacterized protein n=1 Tax=Nocardiopsis terrae TaxID=372655 RepID=A0ABR9HGZ0_9ACTN|nr:hypothetical protein [Nocardiopsis terrae]MBE1458298.1 hypothetical protein [Nocardiopsis terrae]GHC81249.1 hypothetical protein GCM10007079_20850 [Nocardiopsis terrae]